VIAGKLVNDIQAVKEATILLFHFSVDDVVLAANRM
jgi:hypothetical protein